MLDYEVQNCPSRRRFLASTGGGLLAAGVASTIAGAPVSAKPVELPRLEDLKPVELPAWKAATEQQSAPLPNPMPPGERVGYAVVGLGRLTMEQILPALSECKKSRLVALVSGSKEKSATVAKEYGVAPQNIYDYQSYDKLANNPDVHVIYVVLPNSMHAEYTIRGAKAGKHILCEKPMANSSAECQQMIDACGEAGVKLMIAYRMQYEPFNREVIRMARSGELGELKFITADNGQNMGDPTQWRLKKQLSGGGSLPDVGIYCLNATRYLTGEEPIEISAVAHSPAGDPRFKEVEESMAFRLVFPSGTIANCTSSYGQHSLQRYSVMGSRAWAEMNPAFPYKGLRLRSGKPGAKSEEVSEHRLQEKNQFALEIDYMSQCVRDNSTPHTPGEEGLQDLRLIEAIYQSAASSGAAVKLPEVKLRRAALSDEA